MIVHLKILVVIRTRDKLLIVKEEDILAEITNSAITAIRRMITMACNDIPREVNMDQITRVLDSTDSKICQTRQIMAISSTNKIILIITEVVINKITTREDSHHEIKMINIIKEIMPGVKDPGVIQHYTNVKDLGVETVETISLMVITKMIMKEGDSPKIRIGATNSIEIMVKVDSIIIMKIIMDSRISKEGAILTAVITLIRDKIKTISTTIAIKTKMRSILYLNAKERSMS